LAISNAAAFRPTVNLDPEQRKALRQNFPQLAARRLTDLPLLLGEVCRDAQADPDDEWIFASEFGGAMSLERYLESFPHPSPLHFQNSIQAGPIDLLNVAHRRPASLLTPIIGGETLIGDALLTALISPNPVVHLTGGEETAPWTSENKLGSALTLAFYLKLTTGGGAAVGELSYDPAVSGRTPVSPQVFARAVAEREPIAIKLPERGTVRISWA